MKKPIETDTDLVMDDLQSRITRRDFAVGVVATGAATTVLAANQAFAQGAADAARNATQNAVQSAVQSARDEVFTRLELRAGETKRAARFAAATVRPVVQPKKGKLIIRKEGRATSVFYKADKGASGEDSFQYIKVADAGSTENITVAVTIK